VIASRTLERLFLTAAIVMTLGLLWASVIPGSGKAGAYGGLHYVNHFTGYAVLAFAWRRGLPKVPPWAMLAAVIAFAFVQEGIEVAGHGHPFELNDAVVDALGAMVGVAIERALGRMSARAHR
jgi:hypothetical protein